MCRVISDGDRECGGPSCSQALGTHFSRPRSRTAQPQGLLRCHLCLSPKSGLPKLSASCTRGKIKVFATSLGGPAAPKTERGRVDVPCAPRPAPSWDSRECRLVHW